MLGFRPQFVALFAAIALLGPRCATAQAVAAPNVLVLRSGGVLHGEVSIKGDRYVVTQTTGVVDVPAPQVLLVASSLEEAYQKQRGQLAPDSAEAHVRLADWCLRYGLVEAANTEVAEASRLDARDPRVGLMQRRLKVAAQPKKTPAATPSPAAREESPGAQELQKLELAARELPPGAVERFTRKVQPLLVNNCTTSGCHRPGGKQEFQLDRAVLHGLTNRRITLRNLVATLALIDERDPQKSDLLAMTRRVHGGLDRPVLGPRQETQFKQLRDWIALVTETPLGASETLAAAGPRSADGSSSAATPGSFAKGPAAAAQAKHTASPFDSFQVDGRPAALVDHAVTPASFAEPTGDERRLRPQGKVQRGAALRPWEPRDEFDPELFNQLNEKPDDEQSPLIPVTQPQ